MRKEKGKKELYFASKRKREKKALHREGGQEGERKLLLQKKKEKRKDGPKDRIKKGKKRAFKKHNSKEIKEKHKKGKIQNPETEKNTKKEREIKTGQLSGKGRGEHGGQKKRLGRRAGKLNENAPMKGFDKKRRFNGGRMLLIRKKICEKKKIG